ncbi:hypothetical protein N7U66_06055 [Lacinutrix neustonica]|uniref:Peptidase S9A N-terminal domain-containing protein n=1 Tax=Lacinutrix neustonica TaxID=2980107 RepID=A0A9E8MZL0_9FLAO|nr:hypothetical protein [Lacinutrix neustonica]WAC03164.1 hypothetical protein N7U66_06055 [Lacinutrix neustonica]
MLAKPAAFIGFKSKIGLFSPFKFKKNIMTRLISGVLILGFISVTSAQKKQEYPIAPKDSIEDTYFGETIKDPYQWMENPEDPRLLDWLDKQEKLTRRQKKKYVKSWKLRSRLQPCTVELERKNLSCTMKEQIV